MAEEFCTRFHHTSPSADGFVVQQPRRVLYAASLAAGTFLMSR
jgi:hypothetical protein